MKPTFRKSMIWLHTYVGLISGWLLFVVFVTGTLSYYNTEISHWINGNKLSSQQHLLLLDQAMDKLKQQAANADSWQIQLPDERGKSFAIGYRVDGERQRIYLNSETLAPIELKDSNGGNFFRTFHYTLSLRGWGGRYFTGFAAMCMLLGIFTGIYTHRRFFKDFFTLRADNWSKLLKDLHAVFGVISLPFCFVICFSALLIYINMYIPFAIHHHFDSYRNLDRQVSSRYAPVQKAGSELNNLDWQKFLPQLQQQWGQDFQLNSVSVDAPADIHARIVFHQQSEANLSNKSQSLAFELHSGVLVTMPEERLARTIRRIFYGLHEAHFAKPGLRFLLFSLGLISSLIIASGMVIWLQKRQAKQQKKVYIWVEKINLGILYGLPLAVGCYLLSSRLPVTLPVPLKAFELMAFFYTWLSCVVLCLLMRQKLAKLVVLWANCLLYGILFLLDLLPGIGFLLPALMVQDLAYLTVSGLILFAASYFLYVAMRYFKVYRHA